VNADLFFADVLDAPHRLARTLDAYSDRESPLDALPPAGAVGRVVFLGMGSSYFASITAAARLRAAGVDAVAELASTGAPTPPGRGVLAIGVSASGGTAETVAALARHHGVSTTAAVTNADGSDLAAVADVELPLYTGAEAGGVACLTFQATVAVLQLVVGRLLAGAPTVDDLRPAVDAAAELRASREAWLPGLLEVLESAAAIHPIAPAERLSSALQSALMFREGPRLAADGNETGDWLHVDVYLTKRPGYAALLCTGSRFDAEVARWCRERSSTLAAIGAPVDGATLHVPLRRAGDPLVQALVETGVAELAAAELWRRGVAAGDPALL
jgi:fructoselysine-6-P-deglycase FrlB-like protein